MNSSVKPKPLPNLTSIRLFAAVLVVAFHFYVDRFEQLSTYNPLRILLHVGFTGVSIFFVLSGFVLAYNHPSVSSKKAFYTARFARIYPLHLFGLLWMLPVILHYFLTTHDGKSIWAFFASLLLIQTWFPSIALLANSPAWTLSVEVLFYLLFPFLISFVVKQLERRWIWMIAVWVFFLIPPAVANYPSFFGLHLSGMQEQRLHNLMLIPPMRVGEFLIGMFAGAQFRKNPFNTNGLQVAAALFACFFFLAAASGLPHEIFRNAVMAVPYAIVLIALAGWDSPVLAHPVLQFGGEISYGIYILQFPLLHTTHLLFPKYEKMAAVILLPVVASATYIFLEKPARNWILHVTGVRARRKPLPTPPSVP